MYLTLGACAGLLAGLLGIGGGLVIVAVLLWLLPLSGVPAEYAMHAALATSLASILFTAAASAHAHHRRGSVLWPSVWRLVPGLLLGAALGALAATALSGETLRWLVAGYCVLAALQMLLGRVAADDGRPDAPRSPLLMLAGGLIGALSAIVGIGGGSLTVPLLLRLGVAPVRAVGTSSACGVAIAASSAVSYACFGPSGALPSGGIGYVYLPAAASIAAASMLAAPWGTRLAHALSGVALSRVFAMFLLIVGVSLALR
ncbi:MAG: sulfite exporter TauE/SafE family protein [Xanthomonadales bacterium]|nr:sulfite exporter TauE/SafE family protein [Xanthomonadales bacterium]